MDEKNAIRNFYACTKLNDLTGALEALKSISIESINKQDDDGYNMLIQAVVSNDECAVIALLEDNRCDRTLEDNLCGLTAEEFSKEYHESSPIGQALANAKFQEFIYRNNKVIPRKDLYDEIMQNNLEVDKGTFDMLLGDYYRAMLVVNNKISKDEFAIYVNKDEFHYEGQITLLIHDEEYGKQFVDWNYIKACATADEWLSFLRDLPQYGNQADWLTLIKDGSLASWNELIKVCPQFQDKYEEREKYHQKMMKKYVTDFIPGNLFAACQKDDIEVVKSHLLNNMPSNLNKNYIYPMPPGFLIELPLATAVNNNAINCIKLLLDYGADPNVICQHKNNGKSSKELAKDKPEILELFW